MVTAISHSAFGLVLTWNVSAVSHPSPQPPSNTALGKQTIFTAPPQLLKEPGLSEGIAGSSPGLAGGGKRGWTVLTLDKPVSTAGGANN